MKIKKIRTPGWGLLFNTSMYELQVNSGKFFEILFWFTLYSFYQPHEYISMALIGLAEVYIINGHWTDLKKYCSVHIYIIDGY